MVCDEGEEECTVEACGAVSSPGGGLGENESASCGGGSAVIAA